MKKPFDRIIGPNGEWIDGKGFTKPEVVDENGLSEREEFAFRCMNAAANLYGVVTLTEMTAIYNPKMSFWISPTFCLQKGWTIHGSRYGLTTRAASGASCIAI